MPSSVMNNNTSAVAIFGSGFTSATSILFDENPRLSGKVLYKSDDGKILIFSVPQDVYSGNHSVAVYNVYNTYSGITATSSLSNSLNIQVIGN
ncbi:MAG: hypothetical protein IT215_05780 [Chitinophagaceae bacterium]|nr:hypothetical protein [Chitinophagaceae bacterium]